MTESQREFVERKRKEYSEPPHEEWDKALEIIDSLESQLKQADDMLLGIFNSGYCIMTIVEFKIEDYLIERGLIKGEENG